MPLSDKGFKRRAYEEILNEMIEDAKNEFGEDVNVSENGTLGKLLRIEAKRLAKLEEEQEDTYYSAYKNTAEGVQLNRLSPYAGIRRLPAQYAEGTLSIEGTPNYTVPIGFIGATENEVFFQTIEPITLDENGVGEAAITAQEVGAQGNVDASTITVIVNPDANVTAITNPEPTINGREKETDLEFRDRMDVAVEGIGKSTPPAILSALLNTKGVRAATIINNVTWDTDTYNTPGKSYQSFVLGGADLDIFETIINNGPAGIQPFGTITGTAIDLSGNQQPVGFSRAEEVRVYVRMTIQKNNAFPSDGAERVRSELVRYIGGTDVNGSIYAGLNMGDDVIFTQIISRVLKTQGVDDLTIEMSTDGTKYSSGNVAVDVQEVAQCDATDIEVTIIA